VNAVIHIVQHVIYNNLWNAESKTISVQSAAYNDIRWGVVWTIVSNWP